MRKRTTLLLKSFFRASVSLFFIFYTLTPSVLATGDVFSTPNQSVSSTTEDTKGEITKEAVSDQESIVRGEEVAPYRKTKLAEATTKTRGGTYTISSTSGIWTDVAGGSYVTGVNTSEVRWGKSDCMEYVGVWPFGHYENRCSGLGFNGTANQSFSANETFLLGDLTHFNWPVVKGANGAKLKITLNFANPALTPSPTFTYDFKIEETDNTNKLKNCKYYGTSNQISKTPCDDIITFPKAYGQEVFTIGDIKYTLKIDGFTDSYNNGVAGNVINKFVTEEEKDNVAYLVGHLSSVLVEDPKISLMKKVNGDDANNPTGPVVAVGDTVNFEYIVQNIGNVALGGINVTDDKDVPVTCPQTTLESGKSMTCTGSATAVEGQYKNTGKVTTTSHPTVSDTDDAHYYGVEKVQICDATSSHSNPYNNAQASMTGDVQGHDGHNGPVWYPGIQETWGDIIPPFSNGVVTYSGKNWNEYGQSIYNNDCKVPSGTLTVKKVVTPDSDTTSFNITGTGTTSVAGAPTFLDGNTGTISGTQSKTFTVYPGTYSVTEQLPEGWRQVSNTCTNVVIAKGENKECTITNTKEAKLTIVKIAYPGSEQEFTFTSNIPENNTFTLKDTNSSPDVNGSKTFNLIEGTYSVSEKDTDGWNKTSASCSNNDSVSAISLKPGDNVTCTFVNTKYGSISGHKWNDADGLATTADDRTAVSGWTIFIDKDSNAILDEGEISTTTGIDGKYSFTNLLPGTYTISEVLTVGWIQLGNLSQRVTITAGEDKENIDFINVKYPTIQVIKNVDTDGDGTVDQTNVKDWQWLIDKDTYNTGSDPVQKIPGKYIVGERQKDNYHVVSLVCKNGDNEIVNTVAERTEITLQSGDNVVCTFTNARNLGKLIIEKEVVNDNGGSKKATDFSFQIGSETPISFIQNGSDLLGRNEYTRYAGLEYSITEVEANQDGYTTTYEHCTNITVQHNGEVVCKIKNDDNKASLTLVKEVKNDNGGELVATDWTLTATGPTTITGDGGVTSGDNFKAGTYTLSEVGKPTVDVSGYKAGKWSCTDNVVVNENNQITLGLGQSTTCTIVNDDIAPSLELVKVVDNKYGGNAQATDWRLTATNGPVTLTGNGSVVSGDDFKAGTYTLSEVGVVSGYEASSWSCTNGVTVNGNNEITLGLGQSTVCTITNTEKQPTLTLVKTVSNTHGGTKEVSDFNLYIGNDKVTSGVANGVSSNVEYTVREDQLAGYTASEWGGDCSADGKITLKSGENKTCTITNSDIAPTLKLVKKVINDNGGKLEQSNWTLTAKGDGGFDDTGDSTTFHTVKAGVEYILEESNLAGYESKGWSCDGGTFNNQGTITLGLAENVTCTVTNDDIAPTLEIVKKVVNDNGGNATVSDFSITLTDTALIFDDGVDNPTFVGKTYTAKPEVVANKEYTLSEIVAGTGYLQESFICKVNDVRVDSTFKLNLGDVAKCEIVNNDVAPGLTVIKHIKNDNGGNASVNDFEIKLNADLLTFGSGVVSGDTTNYTSTPSVVSNKEYTLSEIDHSGYIEGTWTCRDNYTQAELPSTSLKLSEGQSVTCEITNDDIAPSLKLVKVVDNKYGGNAQPTDWRLTATNGPIILTGNGSAVSGDDFKAGTYTLSEDGVVSGYEASSWSCTNGVTVNGNNEITLGLGQSTVCTITNTEKQPTLTLVKTVSNTHGGTKEVSDFNLYIGNDKVTSGVANGVSSNVEYTVREDQLAGYTASEWGGDCSADGKITLKSGENKTCTITNSDIAPTLKLVKKVINDNGGKLEQSNWTLTAKGDGGFDDTGDSTTFHTVKAGVEYILEESNLAGYESKGWSCDGGTFNNQGTITLSLAENVTCMVTNDDISPTLEIVKTVINDNGGNATVDTFNITLTDTTLEFGEGVPLPTVGNATNYTAKPTVVANKEYTVSEVIENTGYSQDSFVCRIGNVEVNPTFTLKPGENAKCVIVNNDIAPGLTVKKHVKNDNGGNVNVSKFGIKLNNEDLAFETGVVSGDTTTYTSTPSVVSNKEYTLSEVDHSGYTEGTWSCRDNKTQSEISHPFTLLEGQSVICEITNDDISPKLTVIKHVNNEGNDGLKQASDFTIKVDGTNVSNTEFNGSEEGVTVTLNQGQFKVTEIEDTENYTATYEGCEGSINIGESKTCKITNTGKDHKPTIGVTKIADKTSVDETGENVTFTFTVKNTSKVDTVEILSLVDSVYGNLDGEHACKVGNTLAPDAECSFTLTKNISGNANGSSHKNTFTATVKDEERNEVNNSDYEEITFNNVDPTIEVTKTADKASVKETGEDVTFTFTVKNTSKEEVTITSLTDSIFGNLAGSDSCKMGTSLAPNAKCSFTLTKTISGDASGNPHKNTFTAEVKDDEGNEVSDNDDETITFTDVKPSIEVLKTANISEVPETGGEVTFTFKVTNTGLEKVTIKSLKDNVIGTLNGDNDCKVGTELKAGESCEFQQIFTIPSTTAGDENASTSHKNIFTAVVEDNEDNPAEDDDEEEIKLTPVPSLKLVKKVVHKYNSDENITEKDWILGAMTDNGEGFRYKGGTDEFRFVKADVEYSLSESGEYMNQFEASDWSCTGGELEGSTLTLSATDDVVCTITNTAKPATVTVDKKLRGYDDTEIFSDQKFSINLKNDSDNLIRNGEISSSKAIKFEGLDRGKYFVEEVNIPDGYIGEGCTPGKTEVDNGKELNFTCTNKILKPILDIEKTNDTLGVPRYAGNNVTYTIKVSSPDDSSEGKYILKNVLLKDIAPAGFEYQSGSWTADSSLRGNIKGVEPIYNGIDVAEWSLGDMIEGEVITLTYSVRISLTQDPGVYPDVAWAVGKSLMDGDVLTSPVGTEVEVIASNEIEEGDVLGISDTHTQGRDLPNTGASTYLTLGALLTIVFGMLFIFLKDEKKRKVALSGAFLAIATLLLPTAIFAEFPVVKIETPKSPTNSSHYNISFIAAHSDKKIKEVKCFEDGILVKSIPNVNIGNCEISGKTTGTYKYYVSAVYEDDASVSSNEVTVQVDLGKPSAVENYSKNGNVLKFRTANDGRTVKVEIFRANKATFTANASTFIGEMPCASNTECTYTDSTAVANQKYYYAIRAVDSFGSVSPFVSDAEEVVIPAKPGTTGTARTNTTTTVTVGNSTTTSSKESVQGVTDSKGEVKGDETSTIKEEKKDNIKSEPKQTEENSTKSKGNVFKKFWYLWLSGFVIISGGVYAYVRSGKRD